MTDATRRRKALQRIRRLACLDISGPQLAPLLLRELRDVLYFDSAGYFWRNEHGATDLFMDDQAVIDLLPLYMDDYIQKAEREAGRSFEEGLREDFGPIRTEQMIKLPLRQFLRHDYYNLILRPMGLNQCASLVPRLAGGRPTGALKLYRRDPRHHFTDDEMRLFGAQERYLADVLDHTAAGHEQDLVNDAILVATLDGELQWISDQARQILSLAFSSRWHQHSSNLPGMLRFLLKKLSQLSNGREAQGLPHAAITTPHGRFVFKARLMVSTTGQDNVAGIRVEHHRPRHLRVLEALRDMRLPPQQSETFYWLSQGFSEQDIAQRMQISINTVVYHRRQLYARFGAANRRELLSQLDLAIQTTSPQAIIR